MKNLKMKNSRSWIAVVLIYIVLVAMSFAMFSGLVWIACWAFKWEFTWRICIGAYAIAWILGWAFNGNSGR